MPETAGDREHAGSAALARQRRRQVRGLLLLAALALPFLLYRARPLLLFHHRWWIP